MARGNPKPTEKPDWVPDDSSNIVTPSAGRKTSGWLFNVKPPAENHNWFWNLISRFTDYFGAQVEDWIVIDSDADEGDYATLAAYIADAPAANDRILVKEDQTITGQLDLGSDKTIKFIDGARLLSSTNIATSALKLINNIIIEGILNIVLSQTGTTGKAVELDGDNCTGKINVENSSTGTLTTGYHINANKTGNQITGFIDNTGGGTLTNEWVDNSTEDSNNITIVDAVNNVVISTGLVDRTSAQTIGGIKTFSDEIIASSGIQTDGVNTIKTKVIDIGDWDMDTVNKVNVSLGLSIDNVRSVDCIIRDDSDIIRTKLNRPLDWTNPTPQGGITEGTVGGTTVALVRLTGGFYDNVNFNATSYNRGWVIITFIA